MAISKLFDISRRSMLAYQRALTVTSNNVANVNNPNYSRQRSVFSSVAPDYRTRIAIGSGVMMEDIQRIREQLIDKQVLQHKQNFASTQKQSERLAYIESIFSEPSDRGISSLLNNFFNSWSDLSVDPGSTPLRRHVINSAQNLSDKLHSVYDGLKDYKEDLTKDSHTIVSNLNSYISELHTVNKQIYEAKIINGTANDLLDKRDELLGKMSELVNINVTMDEWGVASVSIGGVGAVDRLSEVSFKVLEDSEGKISITTEDENAKLTIRSGELFANTRMVNTLIPGYQEEFDDLFNSIVYNVNSAHNSGFTLTDPPVDSINFFESYSDGILTINADLIDDPRLIAVSSDGSTGNNDIAIQISKLQDEKLVDNLSFAEKYSNLIIGIALEKQHQDQKTESFGLVLNQLEQHASSVSGVSVDEEMVDVLKFQRSYDASAKLISIADEMVQTILQML